ncbi:hypothetical protein [Streptomyces rubrogriseus]|uniref:hypothetical protein n=1 Tax=Streptomyces rubrogriseus TaxID=194673 RepID=UPI000D5957C0|nr:hypothetical protein [Streptomyces rubrogriseus]
MTERERLRDAATDRNRLFRVRDGVGLVLFVAVGAAVLVGVFGGSRWAARESAPVLYGLPGGAWSVGGVLGMVTLLGCGGALSERFGSTVPGDSGKASGVLRGMVRGVCYVAAVAPPLFLLSGLRGKNCRLYELGCSYVPGTGPALLVYVGCVAVLGWLTYRRRRAVPEVRRVLERERLRKLRKKGRGKSRAAAR